MPHFSVEGAEPELHAFAEAAWPASLPAPTCVVSCRHCEQDNRVQVPQAALWPERNECGACGGKLFVGRQEPLCGLAAGAYLHSLDRRYRMALDSIPGVPQLASALLSRVGDRATRMLLMSSAVRCGLDQCPELVRFLEAARRRLDVGTAPELFVGQSPQMNAVSVGFRDPMVMVHSALLEQLTGEEMIAVLGHELGHLHPGHHVYHALGNLLFLGGAAVAGIAGVVAFPLRLALLRWRRASELTADRAALLACGDLGTCIRMLLKFAGGNLAGGGDRTAVQLGPFIRQARELAGQESASLVDGFLAEWLTVGRSHPFVAWRVMHLLQWVERGRYLAILAGHDPRRAGGAARNGRGQG